MSTVSPRAPRLAVSPRVVRPLLLLPVLALLAVFFVWPMLDILLRSLHPEGKAVFGSPTVDFGNYTEIFSDAALRSVVGHTFLVAVWATVITAILAFPTAYLLSRLSRRAAVVVLTLILIPFWVSILVRLFAFTQILGREGVVNDVASTLNLGGPYSLLFNTSATVIGMVAYLLPYMILILYSGMSGVDTTLVTAAKTLGASGAQAFRRVYFPLVRSSLVAGMLLVFVLSLGFFLTPAILGGAQDTTIPIYIQSQISSFQWGSASATGMLLLAVTLVGYAGAIRGGGMGVLTGGESRSLGKGTVEREPLRAGPLAVVLWIAAGVVLLILLLPLLIIVPSSFDTSQSLSWPPKGFTTNWYEDVLTQPLWTDAIAKSAVVAVGTALLSTVVGLILARFAQQLRSKLALSTLQAAVYAPLIVPVILLAVGIYDVQARLGLLGTTAGLVLAHTVIAFPLAFAVLSTALSNMDPALESAAWTLGASRRRTFWKVVMPNITPSVIGALLITFVTSWDEAVIALFQTGLEKTLPVTIFSYIKSGVQPSVAAVATMLVALVLVGMVLLLIGGALVRRRRGRVQK